MSIERGGSAGGGVGEGVATLGGGVGISAGPSIGIGGLESFGVKMTAPLNGSFLENTMPFTYIDLNIPRGGERFNTGINSSIPESAEEVIAGVESILSQASPKPVGTEVPAVFQVEQLPPLHISKPAEVIEQVTTQPGLRAQSLLMLVAARTLLPIPLEILSTPPEVKQAAIVNTEPKVGLQAGTSIKSEPSLLYIQPQPRLNRGQTEVSRVETAQVEEFEEVEEKEAEEPEEEVEQLRLTHSVDKKTVKKRVDQIKNAGAKARDEVKKEGKVIQIPGWRIVKHLISLHWKEFRGDELQKTDPGGTLPDGTWEANMEKVAQETFSSVEDVSERSPKIVALDNPVAKGEGEAVTDENMATTYKYGRSRIHPVHQVIRRIVKTQNK